MGVFTTVQSKVGLRFGVGVFLCSACSGSRLSLVIMSVSCSATALGRGSLFLFFVSCRPYHLFLLGRGVFPMLVFTSRWNIINIFNEGGRKEINFGDFYGNQTK